MKKLILFLLTISAFGQNPTSFPYGIKNTVSTSNSTPTYFVTQEADGIHKKTPAALIATKSDLDLKQVVFTGISQSQFLTENDIVIDNTNLTLTIATVKNGETISGSNPVDFYTDGNGVAIKHTKTAPVVFTFTNTTGIWHFYFNSSGNPIATQTAPADASIIANVYRIYWNSALATADKRVIESIEVYKNDGSWVDREWKNTQGAQYSSGLTISSNVIASGTPAVDGSNAVINLSTGTIIDNNFSYTLTNAASGTTKFTQDLGSGLLPATSGKFITITNNASLVLDKIPATDFPFLWNATTNTPEYLTQLGVRTAVTNNYFFVYYVYALQDPRRGETIKIKSAEIDFANSSLAEGHSWTQLQNLFPTLRDSKIRLLYKLTFEYKTAYDVGTKKSALRKIDDLRKQRTTTSTTVGGSIPASIVTFSPAGNIASTNVQLAIEELDTEKAPLASPSLTGTPTAPTATAGTNTTQIATTAFVTAADAGNVKLTGTQTVTGNKTFSAGNTVFGTQITHYYNNNSANPISWSIQDLAPSQGAFSIGTNTAKLSMRESGPRYISVSDPIESPNGTAANHLVNKSQLDAAVGGAGTVTSVSVTTANGVSGTVATATTTPAISLTLGAITPTSTNGVTAATMAFNDATSSIQTQLNGKSADNSVVHLAGAETITGVKTFSPSVSAVAALAQGTIVTPTLVATANNDVLVGLDIAPTFTNGAFSGVSNIGLRVTGNILGSANITALTNFNSSSNNLILADTGGNVFRGVRSTAWTDALSSRFFQVGTTSDNVIFTSLNGSISNRTMVSSLVTQITTSLFNASRVPAGIFEVTNGTTGFFNVFSTGNVGINQTTDAGYKLDVNGITRLNGAVTITGIPTAPTATAGTNTTQIATTAFVTAADAGNVKLTGNQTITGRKDFSNTGDAAVYVTNSTSDMTGGLVVRNASTGRGFNFLNQGSGQGGILQNQSTGQGLVITNSSTGDALTLESAIAGSGVLLKITKNSVLKSYIEETGLFKYNSDLSGSYDARTLVDKGYVDLKAPLASPTFTGIVTTPSLVSTGKISWGTAATTAGSIANSNSDGTVLRTTTGSIYDFVLKNGDNNIVLKVNTGATGIDVVGSITADNISSVGTVTAPLIVSTGTIRLKNYTVSTLPAGTQGDTAYVTDALAPSYLVTVVGGGAVVTAVFFNGSNWVSH